MIYIGLFLVLMVAGAFYRVENSAAEKLKKWAVGKGYHVISFELVSHAEIMRNGCVPGVAMAALQRHDLSEPVSGRILWERGYFDITSIEFIPDQTMTRADRRALNPQEGVDEERLASLYVVNDRDAQILTEVNRRLDSITSQPKWMEPYDLDGSGHVDQEEWSILRNQVMDKVLGESGDLGVRAVAAPEHNKKTPAPHSGVPQEDDEENLW